MGKNMNTTKSESNPESLTLWNSAKFNARMCVDKTYNMGYTNYSLGILNSTTYQTKFGDSMKCQLSKENILQLIDNLQQLIS